MPKRKDIKKILVVGSGPIVIGQASEFDYSGTQACKVLKEDGYEVVLINSNPATIMTDPEVADRTYVEPITPEYLTKIIEQERPDALLPTIGGQTGLNCSLAVAEAGVLDKYNVELIGASVEAINMAEDRSLFKKALAEVGLKVPESGFAKQLDKAKKIAEDLGYPVVIRPSFTLGGAGGGIAMDEKEFERIASNGIMLSPIDEILIEKSVIGWKEFELEVMRDKNDNVVIVCSIENFDPMGVHTGDSITVAPAQTLTDKEYQNMRNAAISVIRKIGVDTGGSNIQFAINPEDGELVVIEMNPRVSRSSALASKATGFPIAKIAAKLAVGYTLDEIPNDITKETPASFEPTIDYVVVKTPRWAFEKFAETEPTLTTKMQSVGEVMSIGRTFKESLQKSLRSLENDRYGLGADGKDTKEQITDEMLAKPSIDRIFYIRSAIKQGMKTDKIFELSKIDPWFLNQIEQIVELEEKIINADEQEFISLLRTIKEHGFSDYQIGYLRGIEESAVRKLRKRHKVEPVYKTVDTCAAEFEAYTPYYYSTYEEESEVRESNKPKIMILGSGPNRIGQGIEFDYCCVHSSFALQEEGYETIMVNCNPETVSTDYDTSDRLYFEPLTFEDVMNVIEVEKPEAVIIQFGGQTPLKMALDLEKAGVNIIGTSPDSIDLAEDRERFNKILLDLDIAQAPGGTATSFEQASEIADETGYPVLVRPSYVLGGRAMEIVYSKQALESYMHSAVKASPKHPVLIDKFLEGATELDVDAIRDGSEVFIGAIMEHIEEAGIHSGDSSCSIPTFSVKDEHIETMKQHTVKLAKALGVIGLVNIQYAIRNDKVYVIEVNPRASRTVPFVSKATGNPLAKIATKVMIGKKLKDFELTPIENTKHFAVKEVVLPFARFPKADTVLGPEMKSTGEVMGLDDDFGRAFAKAQDAAGAALPQKGNCFISLANSDKHWAPELAKEFAKLGFAILATEGTAKTIEDEGVKIKQVLKIREGSPNVADLIENGSIQMVINTPFGKGPRNDGYYIRTAAVAYNVVCITTIAGAKAAIKGLKGMRELKGRLVKAKALQDYHQEMVSDTSKMPVN